MAGEWCQQLIEFTRTIGETQTGTDIGPEEHRGGRSLVPRNALEVLGERQLARLILAPAFDQSERRSRAPTGDAVRLASELHHLLRKLSEAALQTSYRG